MTGFDGRVRLGLYEQFLSLGRAPSPGEVAAALGEDEAEVSEAYERLARDHVLVLLPGTRELWMANPLSAVPTGFRVETQHGAYFGNCIWDALGIPAMLAADADISTTCPDCEEPLELAVRDGALEPLGWVAHFAVPAARWWDDIGYT